MPTQRSSESERIDLRAVWPNETLNFTPWLANNLDLLGKAIGMGDLKLVQTESYGWAGYLDILAESESQGKVAIENQLDPSDSDHLARLIGYAADCDANVLVWVASHFYEYHLRMLGWLRDVMAGNRQIHAVTVSLARNGDLLPAGKDADGQGFRAVFSAVDLDKEWPKPPVPTEGDRAQIQQKRREFFQPLLDELRRKGFTDKMAPRAGAGQSFPSDFPGITYNVGFWDRPFVYLWFSVGSRAESERAYHALARYEEELQKEWPELQFDVFGQNGGWHWVSVGMSRDGHLADPDEKLDEIRAWMCDNIVRLKEVIDPKLRKAMEQLGNEDPS